MRRSELTRRYMVFMAALFVSALGVSVITRSALGTSPISSIPYVFSLNTPLTMGSCIFILNMLLIAGQVMMLGKEGIRKSRVDLLMQIPISVLFGAFIDLTMAILSHYDPAFYFLKIGSLVLGCAILALGICLEVVADVTMVSGEYFVQIASKRFKKEFGMVKIIFDVSLVIIAAISSLLLAERIDGLREGTVIAALLTGPFVRLISPSLKFIRQWEVKGAPTTNISTTAEQNGSSVSQPVVITISREYGSGGHLIGEQIARDLHIPFYDNELIKMAAEESGFSEQYVSQKEQHLPNGLLYQMVMQDYEAPIEKSLSPEDALFVAQSRVIRRLAEGGPCVIVGRCADYILRENPHVIRIFLYADMAYKTERAIKEYGLNRQNAAEEVARINRSRKTHYYHFTGLHWDDMRNYHLSCDTSVMSNKQVCHVIESLYQEFQRQNADA